MPESEREPLSLLLDADVHVPAAGALRLRGFDVLTVWELGRETMPDDAQLAWAADQGRCLVPFNIGDFSRLHVRWIEEGRHHAGIVVSPQVPLRECLRRCCLLLNRYSPNMLVDQLLWLPRR